MAGKYKYICYCDVSPEGRKLGIEGWYKEVFNKEDELAEKYGVKILFRGTPYGVSESYVTVYESDKPIDNLSKLISATGRSKYVESARTITVTPFE